MQTAPHQSQQCPAEWSGASRLVAKWLARSAAVESAMNLISGVAFLIFGMIGLIFTSGVAAGMSLTVLSLIGVLLAPFGVSLLMLRPLLFGCLFIAFVALSVVHAYKTRWGTESAARVDLGNAFSSATSLAWEFLAVGPILLILSAQDFWRYARLSRMDIPQVSALLVWLYNKGGRAAFTDICMAFPKMNAVRVLPQLRDIPGINWWPDDGEISLSETLRTTFAQILGHEPKNSSSFAGSANQGQHQYQHRHTEPPVAGVDVEVVGWYAALDLPLFASLPQVKARYRKLAKIYHPDAQSKNSASGNIPSDEKMKRINEAYHSILKYSHEHAGIIH